MPDPLNVPVQSRPTPVKTDTLFYEIIDGPEADQNRLEYGSPHPNTSEFLGFYLTKEVRLDHKRAQRFWACEFTLQDTYNESITYSGENKDYPIFTRRYVVLRPLYAARTMLQPLTGLVGVTVTNGGTGYTEVPSVTPNAGAGEFIAVRNEDGNVVWVIITAAGSYTTAPTLTFSGGNGVDAAATAQIQPQTALLVRQRKVPIPDDNPLSGAFEIHECVYETLPGPIIVRQGFDPEDGGLTIDYTQRVQLPASPATLTRTKGLAYTAGYYIEESMVVPDQDAGAVVGTSVWKTKRLPTPTNALALYGYTDDFPPVYETSIDTVTGIIVDIVKQVVTAGTQGSIAANNFKNILTITTGNPGKLTFEIAHGWTTGDVITISGVTGNTPNINTTKTITVVDALNVTLNATNITVAGASGAAYRAGDPDAYIEVQPIGENGFRALSIRSAVRASSVEGDATWFSYPLSQQWAQPPIYTAPVPVSSGDGTSDFGRTWNELGLKEGEFIGWASEAYFTPAQLAAWTFPEVTHKVGGGSYGSASSSNTKVWTFHLPNQTFQVSGDAGPAAGMPIMHVRGDQIKLGLYRVTILEADVGPSTPPSSSSSA